MAQQRRTAAQAQTPQRSAPRETRPTSPQASPGGLDPILRLQRTMGNRQVAQLIQARRLTPDGRVLGVQRQLTVGAADDQYEQEADRVARQVLHPSAAVATHSLQRAMSPEEDKDDMLQTKPLAASITPFVQRQTVSHEESEDREPPVQRQLQLGEDDTDPPQATSAGALRESFEAGAAIETQVSQSKGHGSPLPDPVRAYMEPRFGVDFSQVRVHTGSDARQMNQAVGAQAFTHGSDIYFGAGSSPTNSALIAHELTHVVQQTGGAPSGPELSFQRLCAACAADQREEKESKPSRRVDTPQVKGAPIQRFGALEHKTMGDVGAQQQPYRWDTPAEVASGKRDINYGFELTHGDIVMLSGDLFDARETDEMGNSIPDNLFQLARTPGNNGSVLGSQDEIMYAIYKENPKDIRFKNVCLVPGRTQEDGSPAPTVTFPLVPDPANPFQPYFSEEVKKAVDMRYLNLAARNREHFVAPEGEKSAGPKSGLFKSAGGSYRAMHETAIQMAFEAGQRGEPIDAAMAYEAAAQHYLTDAFASGHLRTPTGSIKTHWDAIYPNFWESLKKFIAHQMAVHINKEWNAATILGTVAYIEDDVRSTLEDKVAAYPALGFERLVALATHDVDNREGLKVINDLGERWVAYGDSQMKDPQKDDSMKHAIEAVELGVKDIREAYGFPMLVTDPLGALQVDGPGGRKYRAEQKMPRVDPEFEATQLSGWQAKDIDDLWDNEIRSGSGYTYGAEFERSAKSGDISDQIGDMAAMIPEVEEVKVKGVYLGTLEPKAAFEAGVATPIKNDTKGTLKRIINFDPSAGQAWFNEDDAVMEAIDRMEARDKKANEAKEGGRADHNSLKGLTLSQRAKWIENLMGGTLSVVWEDEEGRIAQIFETCPPSDRPLLYQMIEGHEWNGDYREGWLTWDDDLYNSLSGSELSKVRDLINEGR